ncbi:hypothetical protein SAMD00019534_100480 [Acytostelium subglobosum LB1]|uniref:hypothetical protein n=1 Tax=Acytostelium subglobosum LB1 TaxID=1410327 RepID=UPI000644D5A6|nr:hypothetical protein SAMD00019534_100480 [Acytostelium subglobosum LB1]GAM26873.1 hypothetical protein SAMD00019534_100480 [Acytostelium subglobosum LB1]|eukprot:XP_012750141.1 hypothetical protein SAMD00019534_100480 [Acytostelium subglobosum LB1]
MDEVIDDVEVDVECDRSSHKLSDDELLSLINDQLQQPVQRPPYLEPSSPHLQACQINADTRLLNAIKTQLKSCFHIITPKLPQPEDEAMERAIEAFFKIPSLQNCSREEFTNRACSHFNDQHGLNVFVCYTAHQCEHYDRHFHFKLRSGFISGPTGFDIYVGVPGRSPNIMVGTNNGDGGSINWGYSGRNCNRDGMTIKFL